jgi:predicted amidohydrolase YtcJ
MPLKPKLSRRKFVQSTAAGSLYAAYILNTGCSAQHDFDMLIINGEVCDGTGAAPFQADVGISNGKIAAIGALQKRTAGKMINTKHKIVAPGFVDIHSHSETRLLVDGRAMSKTLQGIEHVIVNGKVVVHNGEHTGSKPGMVI